MSGDYTVGVDLGTVYTAAATARNGAASVVHLGDRSASVPSVVCLAPSGLYLIGDEASRRSFSDPGRVAREFKRRFGDPVPVLLGGTPVSPEALQAELLRWVLDRVRSSEGGDPAAVVVTYPASWGAMRVDLVQQVARLAGVSNVVTMTEPVAAAYCYAQQGSFATGDTVAVYDLGGGTFDATLVRWTSSSFEVVGEPFGIEHLGGLDLDEAVVAHVVGALSPALDDLDPDDAGAAAMMAALRHEAVLAKEALSADTEADVNIVLADGPHSVRINRSELETLVRPALARTVEVLERAIGSAGLAPGDLSAILLSGGASRTPLISQLIGQRMTTPVITYAHPKYVVALGAAASTSTDRSLPPSPRPAAAAAAVVATAPNATTPPAAPPPPEPPTAAPEPAPPADTPTALEPSEPERRKPRRRLVLLGVLAVLAIAAVAAFLVANRSDKQGVAATSTATQLVLEPASSPGSGAFIAFVSDVTTTTAPPPTTAATSGTLDGPVRRGDEPGVYGSVRGQATCSPAQLAAAITTNTAAASAFASAENMTPADVDAFIKALTPVNLLHDTVVTNHRLTDGQAVAEQSVLEAGTPVLIDLFGLPRVRCQGGNPLQAPTATGAVLPVGTAWSGFALDQVETIKAAELPVASFVLTDSQSGLQFERPGATAGEADTDVGGTTTTTTLAPASSSSSQKSSSSSSSAPTGGPNTTSDLRTVPNVIGLTKSQATNAVTNAGLAAAFNCQFDSQASPDGTVVSQNPAAGTQAPFGSTVNFDVNTSGSC